MKKLLTLLIIFMFLASSARASDPLDARRGENGLLPETDGTYAAETLVQEMRLRLLRGERERFHSLHRLALKHFQSPLMLLYARLGSDLRPAAYENSIAADLLHCRVLLEAADRWGVPEYREFALKKARRILRFNVYRNLLVNSVTWKERPSGFHSIYETDRTLDLAAADVKTLQILQEELPEWEAIAQRCLGVLLVDAASGPLRRRYNIEKSTYGGIPSDYEKLTIMTGLIDGGLVPLRPLGELRAALAETPDRFAASPACAALAAYVLNKSGDPEQAQRLMVSDLSDAAPLETIIFLIVEEKLKTE